ncbi:MAG TPA: M56 family metallopeptidase [Thermoanaerobaculia bacterium]
MNVDFLTSPVAQAIGWALLHLLWQGALVAGILAATLALLSKQSAGVRYAVSCGALALLLILSVGTAWQAYEPPAAAAAAAEAVATQPTLKLGPLAIVLPDDEATQTATIDLLAKARGVLPNVVLLWLVGVAVLSARLAITWSRAYRLVANTTPASAEWQRIVVQLAERLGLTRAVRLVESAAVEVPSVIGWLRPVVLLPASALSGLSMEQIEMILAHELAHVRRHDFFVNLLQAIAETLMFYHPAVWWISRQVRVEREHCCDDLAVAICGKPLQYARALSRLEELRSHAPALAVAANGGSLFDRIKRIATRGGDVPAPASRWVAAVGMLMVIGTAMAMPSLPIFADRDEKAARQSSTSIDVLPPEAPEAPEPPDAADFPDAPEAPEAPEPPEAPEMPELLDVPGTPDFPELAELAALGNIHIDLDMDLDIDLDPDLDIDIDPDADFDIDDDDSDPETRVEVDLDRDGDGQKVRIDVKELRKEKNGRKDKPISGDLTLDEIISLRAVGVTPEYIAEMRGVFGNDLTFGNVTAMKVHGVDSAYVREMRGVFGNDLGAGEIIAARVHGLTPEFVRQMRGVFGNSLTFKNILPLKVHDVDVSYIREMRALFGNEVPVNEVIGLSIHDVTPAYVREMRAAGVDLKKPNEATGLQIADVTVAYVKELAAAGYTKLSVRELIRLGHADVSLRDLEQYRKH